MKTSSLLSAILVSGAFALPITASAQILYTETFTNTPTANLAVSSVGWNAYRSATAGNYTTTAPTGSVDRIGISNIVGNPTPAIGFLFAVNQTTASQTWGAIDTFAALTPGTITWKMGNSATGITVRLLVQNSGNWYASETLFSNASTYTAATFSSSTAPDVTQSLSFSTDAADWRDFTLTPGSSMVLGAPTALDLASSQITGIGFFVQHTSTTNQTLRIDSLEIAAVPEPSIYSMFVLGTLVFSSVLIRRGKRG